MIDDLKNDISFAPPPSPNKKSLLFILSKFDFFLTPSPPFCTMSFISLFIFLKSSLSYLRKMKVADSSKLERMTETFLPHYIFNQKEKGKISMYVVKLACFHFYFNCKLYCIIIHCHPQQVFDRFKLLISPLWIDRQIDTRHQIDRQIERF